MTRPLAVRILALAGIIGLVAQALLLGNLLGINAPLLSAALLAAAWVVRPADRAIDPLDRWLPPAALAMSVGIALRADPTLLALDLLAACGLLGASMAAVAGEAVTRRSAVRIAEMGAMVLGWAAIGAVRVAAATRRIVPAADMSGADGMGAAGQGAGWAGIPSRLPTWVGPVARGLLIAIPALLIFGALFSAADAAFDRLMGRLLTWDVELGEVPVRLTVALVIAWGVAGLLAVAAGGVGLGGGREDDDRLGGPHLDGATPTTSAAEPRAQSLGAAAWTPPQTDHARPELPALRLGAIESATVLIAVDVLFGIFVILQLAYLFGGQDTLAATGLPYAQYARSGFFELVWVAVLAGGLLATVHAIAARRTVVLVAAGLALVGLTAVVLASALLRLRIYQDAYGWTELRFYVLAAIAWLAVGLAITAVLLARDRMRWLLHGLAMSAIGVLLLVNLVGPSRLIAEQNVARVLDPSLVPPDGRSGLDVSYARRLGDDAIPALVSALPALAGTDRSELRFVLERRQRELAEALATGWPSWNLGREAARQALAGLPPR